MFFSRNKPTSQPESRSGISPTLEHYERRRLGERSRIHLRVDGDGSGILLVNASRVMHLNPTAAFMAKMALRELETEQAVRELRKQYRISKDQARSDYTQFCETIDQLLRPDEVCPVHDLDLEILTPFSARPSAPYRMDLALTYRCNNDCTHCYNARPRDYPESSSADWKCMLDRIWELGIPHVVFTGGEPSLRNDLPELVAYAQGKGLISGLNTNARRLSDRQYLQQLVEAGLDHVQITLESHLPEIHDRMVKCRGAWKQTVAGLENALDSPLFVMTNTTMLKDNSPHLAGTLHFLAGLGVPTVGLNALIYSGRGCSAGSGLEETDLLPLLQIARQITEQNEQRLIWYTPTQYCQFDPMQLELGVKGCTAALYNMCVEPDGGVIPCQSFYHQLGNLLQDPWDGIWNHELANYLRERGYMQEKCSACSLMSECGGGCPLVLDHVKGIIP